ncbi:MAG: hypothetical protein R3Y35_03615 [Clostridia bacterium]
MSKTNTNIFIKSYWNYFLELEEQFIGTKRFVEFDCSNFETYSVEYLKLLQAICSEIDVVAKILDEEFDIEFKKIKNKTIQKWGYHLHLEFPNIETISVVFNADYQFCPWSNWKYEKYYDKNNALRYRLIQGKETPFWWTAYNKVKHERTSHYKDGKPNYIRANQKNLTYALGALFILESLYLSNIKDKTGIVYKQSKLFSIEDMQES